MESAVGTYQDDGKVELSTPVEWEPGTLVDVVPKQPLGLLEAEWPTTPEAIAAWAARIKSIEPLDLTAQDEADIAAARAAVREASLQAQREEMGL
jgi:hypothetical protein